MEFRLNNMRFYLALFMKNNNRLLLFLVIDQSLFLMLIDLKKFKISKILLLLIRQNIPVLSLISSKEEYLQDAKH